MENVEQEFLSVIREYERVIYKVCYLYTTPNATLNDLYQDVVLNLWRAYPKFRRECKVSTWIYRIALNTCISFIRKEKNIPEIVTLSQDSDRMEESDETQAMLKQLYRMINRLGPLEKSIILLYLEESPACHFCLFRAFLTRLWKNYFFLRSSKICMVLIIACAAPSMPRTLLSTLRL